MWACVRLPSCTHRSFEAQIFETRPCIAQIDDTISFITSGSLSRGVSVPLALGTASARVEMVPKGAVLIIGAWNYPAALTLGPLVDVLGAGNTAVIKPSELSPRSASVIGRLLEETFTDGEVLVLHGAVKETTQILKLRWDHIVYTGKHPPPPPPVSPPVLIPLPHTHAPDIPLPPPRLPPRPPPHRR